MARINIEDSLFTDQRWFWLISKLGDPQKALGLLVMAWSSAQKNWKKGRGLIPTDDWARLCGSELLIESGFAETREGGVYMKGSEEQFAWLQQRVDSGRLGGLKTQAVAKRSPSKNKRSGKPLLFSPLLSSNKDLFFSSSAEPERSAPVEPCSPVAQQQEKAFPDWVSSDPKILDFFQRAAIKPGSVATWEKTYVDTEWLKFEIWKAIGWMTANPSRKPKSNFDRFLGSWFSRGWEYKRKFGTAATHGNETNWDRVFAEDKK